MHYDDKNNDDDNDDDDDDDVCLYHTFPDMDASEFVDMTHLSSCFGTPTNHTTHIIDSVSPLFSAL